MDKYLSPAFRHSFPQLYCGLTYQLVSKECCIKSNTITLTIALSIIDFKLIKIKSLLISERENSFLNQLN
jgi:hypothetical protein